MAKHESGMRAALRRLRSWRSAARARPHLASTREHLTLPRVLLAAAVLAAFTVGASPPGQETVAQLVRSGDQNMSADEFTFAVDAYLQAETTWPGRASVLLRLGQALLQRHRWEEASRVFLRVPRCAAEGAAALVGLARATDGAGRFGEAREWWREVVRTAPEDASVLLAYGEWLWSRPQPDAALPHTEMAKAEFERALRLDSTLPLAHYRLGLLATATSIRTARDELTAAAQSSVGPVAANARAVLAALPPPDLQNSTDSHNRLGLALLHVNELDLAEGQFREAVRLAPDSPVAYAYLGHIATMRGEPVSARAELELALTLAPEYGLAQYFMGALEQKLERFAEARARFLRVAEADPSNAGARTAVAETYLAEGDLSSAEEWLASAVRTAPEDGQFALALARFYVQRLVGVTERGVPAARRAVALAADSAPAHEVLGWALALSGQAAEGESELAEAIALDPELPSAHYRLGRLLAERGRAEDARYHLIRAQDLDPGGPLEALAAAALRTLP